MLAVSRTHQLPAHRPCDLVRRRAGVSGMGGSSAGPFAQPALLAYLAGLALGAALVAGTTIVAALGLSLTLP